MKATDSFKLHHIGFVVTEIASASELYVRRFGYRIESPVIHDPTQTAFVQFLRLPGGDSYLEFVAPDSETSKLAAYAKKGGGLNHLCYTVQDIEAAVQDLRADQMMVLSEPVSATAFPGRRIAWLMGRDRTPIELVEQGPEGRL